MTGARELLVYVCERRKGGQHRLASVEVDPDGTVMLNVPHIAVGHLGSRPGVWREKPGPAVRKPLDEMPGLLAVACGCGTRRLFASHVDDDLAAHRGRVVVRADPS